NLLDQLVAGIEMLDGQLPALQLVLALRRVAPGARDGGPDRDRASRRAFRIGPDCGIVGGKGKPRQERGDGDRAEQAGSRLERCTAAEVAVEWGFCGHGTFPHWL